MLIPDTVGPTVDAESPVDLQHVVGLSLDPVTNLSSTLPPADLALALCENLVLPTLGLGRRDYWDEVNLFCGSGRASTMPDVRNVTG